MPVGHAGVLEVAAPVVSVEREGLADDVRDEEIVVAVAVEVSRRDPHAAFRVPGRVQRGAGERPIVHERAVVVIDPELVGGRVVGDVEIEPAVAVQIIGDNAEPGAVGAGDPGRFGDVGEMAVTVVPIQTIGCRAIGSRSAVIARARPVRAGLVTGEREIQVVRHEQIEIAIAVVIEEGRARAPERIAHARVACHIGERPVSVVAKQRIRSEARDEEIQVAVVVVVADRDSHAVPAQADTRLGCDIREMQARLAVGFPREIVSEQPAGWVAG